MQDLLSLEDLSAEEITSLLDLADTMKEVVARPIKKLPTLRGKAVANCFFEASTRTRNSFELAGKYLGADVVNLQTSGSSVAKGETLWDTTRTLEAMAVDAVVVRHGASGVPKQIADVVSVPVINAGDGTHQHPTQGLLDLLTVRQRFGRVADLKVVIIGDVLHSRVARSDAAGFSRLGAEVVLAGPPSLLPEGLTGEGVRVAEDLDEALAEADVIQVLRIQRERQSSGEIPSAKEYRARWGLTRERLSRAADRVLVMHPGPQNRGVEIDSDVLDDRAHSAILEQVTNGVAVRMAVLYRLIGGEPSA